MTTVIMTKVSGVANGDYIELPDFKHVCRLPARSFILPGLDLQVDSTWGRITAEDACGVVVFTTGGNDNTFMTFQLRFVFRDRDNFFTSREWLRLLSGKDVSKHIAEILGANIDLNVFGIYVKDTYRMSGPSIVRADVDGVTNHLYYLTEQRT